MAAHSTAARKHRTRRPTTLDRSSPRKTTAALSRRGLLEMRKTSRTTDRPDRLLDVGVRHSDVFQGAVRELPGRGVSPPAFAFPTGPMAATALGEIVRTRQPARTHPWTSSR